MGIVAKFSRLEKENATSTTFPVSGCMYKDIVSRCPFNLCFSSSEKAFLTMK